MKIIRKSLRLFVYSNLAVVGVFALLPALVISGDLNIVESALKVLNKET